MLKDMYQAIRHTSLIDSVKTVLYRLADLAAWHSGYGKRTARESIAILMFHGVHDETMVARRKPPYNSLSIELFTAGVRSLLQRYTVISMDDAVAMLSGRKGWRPRCVALTFDDSLKCLLPTAAAWLSKMGLTATFFISTDVIENRRPYWWKRLEFAVDCAARPQATVTLPNQHSFTITTVLGCCGLTGLKGVLKTLPAAQVESAVQSVEEQLGSLSMSGDEDPYASIMSWDDVRRLVALGMNVGSHSVTHPNLTLLPPHMVRDELEGSRSTIENKTGTECRHFCYPYGDHSQPVCAAARSAGYLSAVTTVAPGLNRRGDDLLMLRRFAMTGPPHKIGLTLARMGLGD